jgi:hypothetical protein
MATKKTKKTKTTTKKTTGRPSSRSTDNTPVVPVSPKEPPKPTVEVRPYKHIGDQVNAFLTEHPNGVYFHLDKASKSENESAIRRLDPKTPVFVDGRSFTAGELQRMGFDVFQNGEGGKLVGIRGV